MYTNSFTNPLIQSFWFHLDCLHGSWTWTRIRGHQLAFICFSFFCIFCFWSRVQ